MIYNDDGKFGDGTRCSLVGGRVAGVTVPAFVVPKGFAGENLPIGPGGVCRAVRDVARAAIVRADHDVAVDDSAGASGVIRPIPRMVFPRRGISHSLTTRIKTFELY